MPLLRIQAAAFSQIPSTVSSPLPPFSSASSFLRCWPIPSTGSPSNVNAVLTTRNRSSAANSFNCSKIFVVTSAMLLAIYDSPLWEHHIVYVLFHRVNSPRIAPHAPRHGAKRPVTSLTTLSKRRCVPSLLRARLSHLELQFAAYCRCRTR